MRPSRVSRLLAFETAVRLLLCAVLACSATSALQAQTDAPLPLFTEMSLPDTETLLTKDPVDWIVLKQKGGVNEVLVVQPVFPRPDTLVKLAEELAKLDSAQTRPPREAGESQDEYRERIDKLRLEASSVRIMLPDVVVSEAAEYSLPVREVDRIIYHEDLMLQRVDKLLDSGERTKAYEMLVALRLSEPDWPGYDQRRNRMVFLEGQERLKNNDLETALAFFEDLTGLQADYPGLQAAIGDTIDQLVLLAQQDGDLRRARFFIARLLERAPNHPSAKRWVDDFTGRAGSLLNGSRAARDSGDYRQALALCNQAAEIWPAHPELRSLYKTVGERYQVLNVGVYRFPGDPMPYPLPADAEQRQQMLKAAQLFSVRRFDRAASYQSAYFEDWTPTDLGRQVVFQLRPRRAGWDPSQPLTAPQVVRAISGRLRPESPLYDERLAATIQSLEVRSPHEFVMNFSSVPVKPQALLRFAVLDESLAADATASDGVSSGNPTAADDGLLSRRFNIAEQEDDLIVFRRNLPQEASGSRFRVEEIAEHRYENHKEAIKALLRGDVSMLPEVPIWLADQFQASEDYAVEPYGIPTTHVLQFNPQSEPMKVSEFRRALAAMPDRERILRDVILKDESMKRGRLVSAPFPSRSYAYRIQVLPRQRDLPLVFPLLAVTKKKLNGALPELTMLCDPDEVAQLAAQELVSDWKKVGITVKLVTDPKEPTPANWDILYRRVRMAEPVTELWPFLTMKPDARVEDLEHLPDWLRQQLIELEQTVDFSSAVSQLHRLHYRLHELYHIIPLWEIDDVMVLRRSTIQGYPTGMMHPYQDVERWVVNPVVPGDLF